jgi:nitrate reductase delta subunit
MELSIMNAFESLAAVLEYPGEELSGKLSDCRESLHDDYPEAARKLEKFDEYAAAVSLDSLRELYTVTFDLNPVCTLDIGYHVFGESYKRGAFLAGLQRALGEHGLETGAELPDHLTVILRLLSRMESDEDRSELVKLILAPALARMNKAFEDGGNPYAGVIRAVDLIIRRDFSIDETEAAVTQADLSFFGTKFNTQGCPDTGTNWGSGSSSCPLDGRCHGE